eukprot:gnl/TRDRNA2_/TRDRNA2_190420_c0_seq1.p1 gnl/TRDRNA2_/TRDRNA2_190420_c0~~gnl/TRDRNA2_/TRDRNA2_190420_c0_seq1.p1  ORF type:complete len:377 (+),score=113.33 gnl/TRDRNA2_/TRDRNA2_190420_c0_seq1:63-1193(+)
MDASDSLDDEEALCQVLQAHVRTLEQQELSQMRQGAILQRKFDQAMEQRKSAQVQQELRRKEHAKLRDERLRARDSEGNRDRSDAANALEAELQGRLEASSRTTMALEKQVREVQAERREVQEDLCFWRRCAQLLLAQQEGSVAASEESRPDGQSAGLRIEAERLVTEDNALRRTCENLEVRLAEVDKIARAARSQELQLRMRNEKLASEVARAEAAAQEARTTAAAEWQKEQAARGEIEELEARLARSLQECSELPAGNAAVSDSLSDGRAEELAYLRRKKTDKEQEVKQMQQQQSQLKAALQRHTGFEVSQQAPELEQGSEGDTLLGALDEPVSRGVMMLFKSILVRRLFCVHLCVLYAWVLFLLWWMSETNMR